MLMQRSCHFMMAQEKREGVNAARRALADKDKMKLEPESVFFEGAPHWSEVRNVSIES